MLTRGSPRRFRPCSTTCSSTEGGCVASPVIVIPIQERSPTGFPSSLWRISRRPTHRRIHESIDNSSFLGSIV